ncbi:cation transporter [Ligilactobacillus salitolerans]|uniref:Cation transporter n=1 Tax=Ligilactobacillus salitolerans TaxID=1808352 RepID=A0A401IQC4_9LACO|nr:cation diffusion facilitator family transporter [Ligilactobacillus salitolerans]GBG93731.1 cation transporter [Ligilactobacillus salitolerans]
MNSEKMSHTKLASRRYWVGIILNIIFIVIEFVFGGVANSIALVTDAVHNLADVLSLVLSLFALYLMSKKPTKRHTYGFYNTTIMSALTNSIILFVSLTAVIWESIVRLMHETSGAQPVGWLVALVAFGGVLINGLTSYLMKGSMELNDRSNFWHFFGDTLLSLAVVITGLIISFTGWRWLDPVVSILAAIFILYESWSVLSESLAMATNAVPRGIESSAVEKYLLKIPQVKAINDLHIWPLSTTQTALSAHLEISRDCDYFKTLDAVTNGLEHDFKIEHVTIQLETCDKEHCEADI